MQTMAEAIAEITRVMPRLADVRQGRGKKVNIGSRYEGVPTVSRKANGDYEELLPEPGEHMAYLQSALLLQDEPQPVSLMKRLQRAVAMFFMIGGL